MKFYLGALEVSISLFLALLDDCFHRVDVRVYLPQLFHMGHFFLHEYFQFFLVLGKAFLFVVCAFHLALQPALQALELLSVAPISGAQQKKAEEWTS